MYSKIYADTENKYIIMVNHKCGFMSLNTCLTDKNLVNNFDTVKDNSIFKSFIEANNMDEYKKILIVREPIQRACSYYNQFVFTRFHGHPIFNKLRRVMGNDYITFERNFTGDKPVAFELFCKYLQDIMDNNPMINVHLQPQYKLFYDNEEPLFTLDKIIKQESFDYEYFKTLTTYDYGHMNKSRSYNYEDFLNDNSIALLKEFYKKDYELFYS